ncbi:glycosyltransferase [Terrimonas sp. NA20]|uniref:Glycosyltransferase n=1 Tax=Terrimonas ginsenosidimutans TaxID=2908004 RepID=A0ABS9KNU5_9BACT|nr:glycosyltransferase family 2 protein [Terrimonas ginsenosidimutans]MCG2613976.1 glycosyltransferase [Terrimonas ginsenosidimutans]
MYENKVVKVNMNSRLVSVIMPAYNAAAFIGESIQSVIAQTYQYWELIIIDDGSTDATAERIKKFAEKDERIKYIYQENGRQGKARNNGIRNSRGEYIAFLDADDLWVPHKLAIQVDLINKEMVDLVFSDAHAFQENKDHSFSMSVQPGNFKGSHDFAYFLETNRIPILTVLTKRTAIEQVNGFSERTELQNAEDLHLWLKLLLEGYSFFALKDSLAYYRLAANSATAHDRQVIFQSLFVLQDLSLLYPVYKKEISRAFNTRIHQFICQNNINDGKVLERLLDIGNAIKKKPSAAVAFKWAYRLLGKRLFRLMYKRFSTDPHKVQLIEDVSSISI